MTEPTQAQAEDTASIAAFVADTMRDGTGLPSGWEVSWRDLGEVEVGAPNGQRFRLYVEEISDED